MYIDLHMLCFITEQSLTAIWSVFPYKANSLCVVYVIKLLKIQYRG